LPVGKRLITLRDAAHYITKLPRQRTMPKNGRPRCRRYCWSPNMTGNYVRPDRRDASAPSA
jgi:hypothetical protein